MAEEEVALRVSLKDRRETVAGLKDVDGQVTRLGRTVSDTGRRAATTGAAGFDRMSHAARGLARSAGKGLVVGLAAGGAAVAGFTVWVSKGYEALRRIQTIGAQTDAVIRSTGGAAGVTRDQIDGLAGKLESLTGVEAESITEGQNLLLTFTNIRNGAGKGNKIFDQTTRIMTDMSVALGKDAAGSATMLGKALNDPLKGISALSRVGVSFTEQQKKQVEALVSSGKTMEAQKLILAELKKEFGGSAAAFGQTDTGKIARFDHAIGTLQETIAGAFAPTLGDLATQLVDKGVPALERWGATFDSDVKPRIESTMSAASELWGVLREDGLVAATARLEEMTGTQGQLVPIVEQVLTVAGDLADVVTGSVVPAFTGAGGAASALLSPLTYVDDVLGWMADHTGLVTVAIQGLIVVLTLAKAITLGQAAATALSLFWLKAHTVGTKTHLAVGLVARTATIAWAAAQWALNAAMSANPIGLVVLAIVGLVAGLVLAWKRSETFRNIVLGAWKAIKAGVSAAVGWLKSAVPAAFAFVKNAFLKYTPLGIVISHYNQIKAAATAVVGWVKDKFNGFVDFFRKMPGRIAGAAAGMWDGITGSVKGAINTIIDAWNRLDFSINITVPDWVPGVGGKGFSVADIFPDIPRLAAGGVVAARPGGILANIGEGRWDEAVVPLNGRDYLINGNGVTDLGATVQAPRMAELPAPSDYSDDDMPEPPDWWDRELHVHVHVDGKEVTEAVLNDLGGRGARG